MNRSKWASTFAKDFPNGAVMAWDGDDPEEGVFYNLSTPEVVGMEGAFDPVIKLSVSDTNKEFVGNLSQYEQTQKTPPVFLLDLGLGKKMLLAPKEAQS